VGICIHTKYWELLYVEQWEDVFTQNTKEYCMLSTMGRYIYKKYWGLLYVEHYEKIYLPQCSTRSYSSVFCVNKSPHSVQHKVLPNILCK
jgi:hypothetical protein